MEKTDLITTLARKPWHKGRTPEGILREVERKRRLARQRILDGRHKASKAEYDKRQKQLYGGRLDMNMTARLRWLIEKEGVEVIVE